MEPHDLNERLNSAVTLSERAAFLAYISVCEDPGAIYGHLKSAVLRGWESANKRDGLAAFEVVGEITALLWLSGISGSHLLSDRFRVWASKLYCYTGKPIFYAAAKFLHLDIPKLDNDVWAHSKFCVGVSRHLALDFLMQSGGLIELPV